MTAHFTPTGKAHTINRTVTFPVKELPSYESVMLSLTEKYGPPTGDAERFDTVVWIVELDGRIRPGLAKPERALRKKEKVSSGRTPPAPESSGPSRSEYDSFVKNLENCTNGQPSASCGESVVAARIQKGLAAGGMVVSQFTVTLWGPRFAKENSQQRKKISDALLEAEKNQPVEKAKVKL